MKPSICNWLAFYKSGRAALGIYAMKVTCLTLRDLHCVNGLTDIQVIECDLIAEVSRGHSRYFLDTEGLNNSGWKPPLQIDRNASGKQQTLPLANPGDEPINGNVAAMTSNADSSLMARILEPENLKRAYQQAVRNRGAPGIDGVTVFELSDYLIANWRNHLRPRVLAGDYRPQPVKRVTIPKPNGGSRNLGIPTVFDRFVQQAIAQVLQTLWEPAFHECSFGFRPKRNAHQAIR